MMTIVYPNPNPNPNPHPNPHPTLGEFEKKLRQKVAELRTTEADKTKLQVCHLCSAIRFGI